MVTSLGVISPVPKGEWDKDTSYERLNIVNYNGETYIVKKTCVGVTPAENEYYMKVTMANASSGTQIQVSVTEPSGMKERSVWWQPYV